jgi:Skp family chaperone for outer membrane proteins
VTINAFIAMPQATLQALAIVNPKKIYSNSYNGKPQNLEAKPSLSQTALILIQKLNNT